MKGFVKRNEKVPKAKIKNLSIERRGMSAVFICFTNLFFDWATLASFILFSFFQYSFNTADGK